MRFVVLVEARDRPGILEEIVATLRGLGANIVTNFGYRTDEKARLLFIVDVSGESEEAAEKIINKLESIKGVESVEAAELGPESAELIAKFVRDRLGLITILEFYLEPADLLDVISLLPEEERKRAYTLLSPGFLAKILLAGDEGVASEVAESLGVEQLVKAIETLPDDDAGEVVRKLPPSIRAEVLKRLPRERREKLIGFLEYPAESVGAIMTTSIPVLQAESTVAEALREIGSGRYTVNDMVIVVDSKGRLVGVVPVNVLIRSKPTEKLAKLATTPRATIKPDEDREEAARLMLRYDVPRLPVVSSDGRFLGVVTLEEAARVLAEEAGEDIVKLAAIEKPKERYRYMSPLELVKLRLPWLVLIYLIESVTAGIIKSYEDLISKVAILAAFLPLLADTSGNIGSQASSMIVRALALGEISEKSRLDMIYVVLKEMTAASLIGISLASLGFAIAFILSGGNLRIAVVVALTLYVVVMLADIMGSILPILARRVGVDPATLSSPLITTIMDIVVILTYFTLASKMLNLSP